MRVTCLCALLFSGLACSAAGAQEESRRPPDKVLAPYVNATTFAVVALDVQKLDLEAGFDHLVKPRLPPGVREELAKQRDLAGQLRSGFLRAGGRELYVVFNLPENLAGGPLPLLVMPADKAET